MPSPETRTPDPERRAQMVAPLRDAFPLPPTDARFAELVARLTNAGRPASRGTEGPASDPA